MSLEVGGATPICVGMALARRARKPVAPPSRRKELARQRMVALARLMDEAVYVPVLGTRVGLDALLGLVPVAGDLVSAGIGLYIVAQARELGASRWLQARMVGNLLADAAIGAVPLAGDLADVYFKAHRRNLKLLQRTLGEPYIDIVEPLPARRGRARSSGR
jgi:hypothetical protein